MGAALRVLGGVGGRSGAGGGVTGTSAGRGSNLASSTVNGGAFGATPAKPFVTKYATIEQGIEWVFEIGMDVTTIAQVLFAIFVTCFLVLRILGACCGNTLKPVQSIAQWFTRQFDQYDELRQAMDPSSGKSLARQWMSFVLAALAWFFPLLPMRGIAIVTITVRGFCYNCWLLLLVFGAAVVALTVESQFGTMVAYVVDASDLATSAANTASSGFNTALDASNAMLPLYNVQAGQSIKYYYGLWQVLQETQSINTAIGIPGPLSGRRQLVVGDPVQDPLAEVFSALEKGAITMATKQEILSDVERIVQLVVIALTIEAVAIVSAVLPGLAHSGTCGAFNAECFVREYISVAANSVLSVINTVATFFGGSALHLPAALSACSGPDFSNGMPCSCASSEGGPYALLSSCGPATVTCTTNCGSGRRALTLMGALLHTEKFAADGFSTKCFRVDLLAQNGTLWEVCPEPETRKVAWTLLSDEPPGSEKAGGGGGGRRRLASAKEARAHLADTLGEPKLPSDVRIKAGVAKPPAAAAAASAPSRSPGAARAAEPRSQETAELDRAIAALERASAVRMSATFVTIGKLRVACRELAARSLAELRSPVELALSVACVAASLADGVAPGSGATANEYVARSHADALLEVRENMLLSLRAVFSKGSGSSGKRRQLAEGEGGAEGGTGSRAMHAVVRRAAALRSRVAVLSAAAQKAHAGAGGAGGAPGDISPEESPLAHAAQLTVRRFRALAEKEKRRQSASNSNSRRRLSTDSGSPTSAPTSLLPKTRAGWGVFGVPSVCGVTSKACPGIPNQCYALDAQCPYPSGANFLAIGQWGVQYANSETSGWSPASLLVDAVQCPAQWFSNPQSDPAFHLGDNTNPGTLCYPQVTPWPYGYATEVDLRVSPYIDSFCAGPGNENACSCVYYRTGLFDVNIYTWAGFSQAVWIILFNGALCFWTFYTTIFYYVGGPALVDFFWNPTFRALGFPAWVVQFWSTQAQPGTATHRITCATLHSGEFYMVAFWVLLVIIVLVQPAVYVYAIVVEALEILECFVVLVVRTFTGTVWEVRVFGFRNVEDGREAVKQGAPRAMRMLHRRVMGAPLALDPDAATGAREKAQ